MKVMREFARFASGHSAASFLNAFKVEMKSAHDHVDALCNCLSGLERLPTFSVFLDDQVDSLCYFPGPLIARIVRALPPSLVHLDLNTECVDRISEFDHSRYGDDHLCIAISERVPSLESLRLRLSCLCTDVFRKLSPTKPSNLCRAFICLDTSPLKESHLAVDCNVGDCAIPRRLGGRVRGNWHGALLLVKLTNHLLDL